MGRIVGTEVYFITEDCDTNRSLPAIRANCLKVCIGSLGEAITHLLCAALDGKTNVGIVDVRGAILERAFAYDSVRHCYYVTPLVVSEDTSGYSRVLTETSSDGKLSLWFLRDRCVRMAVSVDSAQLQRTEVPEWHTAQYYNNLCTVHA